MTPTYFPKFAAALPEPRFTPPQQDFAPVLGSAIQTLTGVANNFRQKQMSVQSADRMADALEAEGLTQEASMYRRAAQAYDTNFFSTPEQNEQFNRTLLTDSLRLLQQSRENKLKEQAQSIQSEYYQGLVSSRSDASADRAAAASERSMDRQNALAETQRNNRARSIASRLDDVVNEAKILQGELGDIQTAVQKGLRDSKDPSVLRRAAEIQARLKLVGEEYNQGKAELRSVLDADQSGNSQSVPVSPTNLFYREGNPLAGIIPQPEVATQQLQSNVDMLNQNPNIRRIGQVSTIDAGRTSTTVGPTGTSTTTTTPNEAIRGVKKDPTAPNTPEKFSPNKF